MSKNINTTEDTKPVEETGQKTINDLSIIELKAVAYDLLSQRQMIDNSLTQVNAKLAEKLKAEEG